MSLLARFERRFDVATAFAQRALELSTVIGTSNRDVLNLMAGIALEAGKVSTAIRVSRKAQQERASSHHGLWTSHLFEAEALAQASRYTEAQAICNRVRAEGQPLGERLSSWLCRAEALILYGLRDDRSACRSVRNAIDLLGAGAPAFYRLKNLVVAERLHPTKRQRLQIHELEATLGWRM
jgi:hypothetical protein